ncbi:MAG: hypothetical protein AABY26_05950, partial [Nanoarchaeota archaeon]
RLYGGNISSVLLLMYVSRGDDDYVTFWRSADQYHIIKDAYPKVAMAEIKVDLKVYDLLGTYTKVIGEIMETVKQHKEKKRKRTKKNSKGVLTLK